MYQTLLHSDQCTLFSVVTPAYTIFMGEDKHESKYLMKGCTGAWHIKSDD